MTFTNISTIIITGGDTAERCHAMNTFGPLSLNNYVHVCQNEQILPVLVSSN